MVRIMVGTLIDVSLGKINSEQIEDIILSGDRKKAGRTVSPVGLYLKKVKY
jgi:tRNA pseudouridine38-40 synthase